MAAGDGGPLAAPFALQVYVWCAGISVTSLLVADFVGAKFFAYPVHVGGWQLQHSVGMLTFPLTFLITDLVNEYFGGRGARRIAYLSFGMGGLAYLALVIAQAMPVAKESPVSQAQFDAVFGPARGIYLASLLAYLAGQLCDILVFRVFKRWTGERLLWLRATGSTIFSQMIDSFVITSIFLWGQGVLSDGSPVTWSFVLATAATGYVLKFLMAIATTPLIYLAHALLRPRLRPV